MFQSYVEVRLKAEHQQRKLVQYRGRLVHSVLIGRVFNKSNFYFVLLLLQAIFILDKYFNMLYIVTSIRPVKKKKTKISNKYEL